MKAQPMLTAAIVALGVAPWIACLQGETGQLRGVVQDELGRGIPGAWVSIDGLESGALSDEDGAFDLSFPPGAFDVRVEAKNYIDATKGWTISQPVKIQASPIKLTLSPPGDGLFILAEEGYRALRPEPIFVAEPREKSYLGGSNSYVSVDGEGAPLCLGQKILWSHQGEERGEIRALWIRAGGRLWPLDEGLGGGDAASMKISSVVDGVDSIYLREEGLTALIPWNGWESPVAYLVEVRSCEETEGARHGRQ